MVERIVRDLYRPVFWIRKPERSPPTVLPRTAGKRCVPATVLELDCVARK